jgi:hypothetical protein
VRGGSLREGEDGSGADGQHSGGCGRGQVAGRLLFRLEGESSLPSRRSVTLAKSTGENGRSIRSDRLKYVAITAPLPGRMRHRTPPDER